MAKDDTYRNEGHPLHGRPVRRRLDSFAFGLLEVFCAHGIGHPIPESVAHMARATGQPEEAWGTHGCDGCCRRRDPLDLTDEERMY